MNDKQVEKILKQEKTRQKNVINLIASENYVSPDVLKALGSEFTNKYAEGYPGRRYYGGNIHADEIEKLCQTRALKLFGLNGDAWAVNVQPLSGSPANIAVYSALVPLGGKIMGMSLDHGGHLTHGHKASLTGKWWVQIPYRVNKETEVLDYEELRRIAVSEKPAMIVAGFTAYPRTIDWKRMRDIANEVGALLHVDMSHLAGLIAGGAHPSPFPYADTVMTTTHKTLRGPRGALIFSKVDDRGLPQKIDKAVFPGIQGGPHVNQIAATTIALGEASKSTFKTYAQRVIENAQTLARELARYGWRVVSGGTDTHIILLDTWMNGSGISGDEASKALEHANIIVNKNTIPYDERSPIDPSGIRLGTAAETTRGKGKKDMLAIAKKIDTVLRDTTKKHAR